MVLAESNHHYSRAYRCSPFQPAWRSRACLLPSSSIPIPCASRNRRPPRITTTGLPRAFWIYMAAAGLLAAGFIDFPLIAFHFNKTSLATPAQIPVFYAAAIRVEALTALVFGKLFDRIGMPALIIGVVLSAASSQLAFFGSFYSPRGVPPVQ